MAKRNRSGGRRRGLRGLGAVLSSGVSRDVTPPLVGLTLGAGTALAIRAAVSNPTTETAANAYKYAGLIGAGVGAIVGGGSIYLLAGRNAGLAAGVTGLLSGLAVFVADKLLLGKDAASAAQHTAILAASAAPVAPSSGVGALVPETGGMGAIVMEPFNGMRGLGAAGETVNIAPGMAGIVNPGVFGN